MRRLAPLLVLALSALGCQGSLSDHSGINRPGAGGLGPGGPGVFVPPETAIRRLTRTQIQNAVADVFGPGVTVSLPDDLDSRPEMFTSVEASRETVTRRSADLYEEAALGVAQQVIADASRYPELDGCAADPSAACARPALARFGAELFRRPLDDAELDRFGAIVEAGGTTLEARQMGLEYALAGLLIAPSFLYLHHRGEDAGEGLRRYSDWELANRLSAFLWDSIPDDELLRAASEGELSDADGVEVQVRRMLADDRAAGLAGRFFGEAWRVSHHLDGGSKSPEVFPEWSAEMADLYRAEFDVTMRELIMRGDEDLRVLFTGETTYVNAELGAIYGVEVAGDGWQPVTLPPERHGLLTSGAVMSANANPDRTSPTHRGLFIFAQFLCGETDEPPAGVVFPDVDLTEMTGRQIVETHLEEAACQGCHAAFDPLGLAFERFDAIGRHRIEELGEPVNDTVELDGQVLEGSGELAEVLVEDPRVPRCIARNLYSFASGTLGGRDQLALTNPLGDGLVAADWSFHELVVALAVSEQFRLYREASEDGQ